MIYVSGSIYFHCARGMRAGTSNFYSPTLVGTDRTFFFVVVHFYYENWNPSKLQKAKLFFGLETSVFFNPIVLTKTAYTFFIKHALLSPKKWNSMSLCTLRIYLFIYYTRVPPFASIFRDILSDRNWNWWHQQKGWKHVLRTGLFNLYRTGDSISSPIYSK